MKIISFALFLLFFSGLNSVCSAKQAILITPAVQAQAGTVVVCALTNVTASTLTATIQMYNDVGSIVQSQENMSILPNQVGAIFFTATTNNFYCKFIGVKSTKARGAMNFLENTMAGDRPYLSIAAN